MSRGVITFLETLFEIKVYSQRNGWQLYYYFPRTSSKVSGLQNFHEKWQVVMIKAIVRRSKTLLRPMKSWFSIMMCKLILINWWHNLKIRCVLALLVFIIACRCHIEQCFYRYLRSKGVTNVLVTQVGLLPS